ncbi:MAG TPA: mobilization protein [Syntrophorhabdus sp.]|nr:mobilization protein [Syntrophorhabdus sp.]
MQPKKPDSLSKLLEKKQKLEQQIASAKARAKKADRADDTRRKILVGAYFIEVKYKDDQDELKKLMDGFLVRDNDRALFGLPPKGQDS